MSTVKKSVYVLKNLNIIEQIVKKVRIMKYKTRFFMRMYSHVDMQMLIDLN